MLRTRLIEFWRRIRTTRYTRALEACAHVECALKEEIARQRDEIALLRAENRALLNSILGIAGVPPIPVTAPAPEGLPEKFVGRGVAAPAPNHEPRTSTANGARVTAPMRRRSWHQIHRILEIESRKRVASE